MNGYGNSNCRQSSGRPTMSARWDNFTAPHLQGIVNEGGERAEFVVVLNHLSHVAEIDNVRFESSMKGYLAHCYGTNRRTKGEAYLSDFGFGVGQCVPIFVQR